MSTPEAVKKEVATPKLVPNRRKLAEYARRVHRVYPEQSAELKDLLDPGYWAHVAAEFTNGDMIEALPEGGAWYAQLIVVGCSKQHARVAVVSMTKLRSAEEAPKDKPAFTAEFKGPQRKWSVIRTSDKSYVKEGLDSKEEALKWLEDNEADLLGLA